MSLSVEYQQDLKFNILGKIYYIKENLIINLEELKEFYDENRHEYILDISPLIFDNILEYYSTKQLYRPTNISFNYYKDTLDKLRIDTSNLDIQQYHERIIPNGRIRQILHVLLEYSDSCRLARILNYICSMIALLSCLIVSLSLTYRNSNIDFHHWNLTHQEQSINSKISKVHFQKSLSRFFIIDCICLCWILIETCLRLISIISLYDYLSKLGLFDIIGVSSHLISLILIKIYSLNTNEINYQIIFLSLLRKVRLVRYIRPLKYFLLSLIKSKNELKRLFIFISFLLAFLAPLIFIIESSSIYKNSQISVIRNIRTISDACYFLILLITTVGFGEIYPTTILAKFISMLASLSSLMIFSLILSSIYRKYIFIYEYNEIQRIDKDNIRYLIYENKNQQQTRDITNEIKTLMNII